MTVKTIVAAGLAALFAGCASSDAIRVGSYNIRLEPGDKGTPNAWQERREDLVALVKKLDLDVFGMQEVCPPQAQYFRENLSDWELVSDLGAGAPVIFTGDHNCREDEKPARAVSEILENALYRSEAPPKGAWRTFNGWQWRDEEVSSVEALKQPIEVRNARKGSPDAVKVDGRHPYEKFGPRIDYIYVSPGVRVLNCETVDAPRPGKKLYPSDHFPVVAEVVLP